MLGEKLCIAAKKQLLKTTLHVTATTHCQKDMAASVLAKRGIHKNYRALACVIKQTLRSAAVLGLLCSLRPFSSVLAVVLRPGV